MYSKTLIIFLVQIAVGQVHSQLQGDNCILSNNIQGKCTNIIQCPIAIKQLKQRIRPETCGFLRYNPIVCCPTKNSSKSAEACNKYGQQLNRKKRNVYGNDSVDGIFAGSHVQYRIPHMDVPSIVGGEDATFGEYLHMAAIGFGTKENIQWKCGGSLISDKFVLTAAHCLRDENGEAKFVQMGDKNLVGYSFSRQNFEIIRRIPHPDYKPPIVYNDIALIELDKSAKFSVQVKPACLHQELVTDEFDIIMATGWGLTQHSGNSSNILQEVHLSLFTYEECNRAYRSGKRLPNGILEDRMVCAGGRDKEADTCQGDSGGPIHTFRYQKNFYSIIGVTAFGKACGVLNVPSVYSKVAYYVPWIESIVWP